MPPVELRIDRVDGGSWSAAVVVERLLLAGYTGRDQAAVLAHVKELEALGVPPPTRIPAVFVVDPDLVRATGTLDASGPSTSGEVEMVLVHTGGELLVGVGSDHTDRAHEAIDLDASKSLCCKPMAATVWSYEEVEAHWDDLELRSWTTVGSDRRLYQQGTLAEFLTVAALFEALVDAGNPPRDGTVVFGGTLPTIGGLEFGDRFDIQLNDPVLGRAIAGGYDVVAPAPPTSR
jgi:Protein of unknown function (DUF2848)